MAEQTKQLRIEFPIYESVRDSQLQHGLKYDDHRQYRSYCSRRLHRVRRSLNVHQSIPATAKARHQRAKKLMDVSNAMVLEAGDKNEEYANRMLIIPLYLAERAWSFAMQLKQEVAEYPRKRFHLVRRLKKAAAYASKFEKLVHDSESPCSERTKMEATAYAAYMNGLFLLEREQWAEAKENFNKSLLLYTNLSLSVKSDQVIEQYRLRMEELRASLRYCTFTLGEKPKEFKIKLPSTLQFHDIAFKHASHALEPEPELKPEKSDENETVGAEESKDKVKQNQPSVEEKNENDEEEEEEDDDDDDDDEFEDATQQSGNAPGGGVTGLVKSWLFSK